MPCHEWWIQRILPSTSSRERETRAAISADVTRFLEEAEGAEEEPAQQGSPPWVRSQIRGDGVKSVVTEQRYRPAQQGSPPIPVEQQNRLGDSGESMKTVRRHMSAGQKTKSDLGAEMPVEHRWGPVEHFVVTNGVSRRTTPQNYGDYEPRAPWTFEAVEQRYRLAAHASKPIPVYDARDYGDDLDEILPR